MLNWLNEVENGHGVVFYHGHGGTAECTHEARAFLGCPLLKAEILEVKWPVVTIQFSQAVTLPDKGSFVSTSTRGIDDTTAVRQYKACRDESSGRSWMLFMDGDSPPSWAAGATLTLCGHDDWMPRADAGIREKCMTSSCVPVDWLLKQLNKADCTRFVFIDACRDFLEGPFSPRVSPGLALSMPMRGMLVSTSTMPGCLLYTSPSPRDS